MSISKVCGIETEYGILVRGADSNPVSASSLLINAYLSSTNRKVTWDFEDERPGNDARGFSVDDLLAPEVDTHLVNAVLTNGARYYVDHAHPEVSTPECLTAREVVRLDRAAEEIVRASMDAAKSFLATGGEILCHKNNSDGKGNSYGCHENYLMAREVPFGRIVAQITPHFVTRQVVIGAGKVGCELPGRAVERRSVPAVPAGRLLRGGGRPGDHAEAADRQHPRRAALRRLQVPPPARHRRRREHERGGHVRQGRRHRTGVGDDRGRRPRRRAAAGQPGRGDPAGEPRPHARPHVLLRSGRRATALEIQWALVERARKYEQSHGLSAVGEDVGVEVLALWESLLTGLEHDPGSVADSVDWVAKQRLVDGYAERHALRPGDPRLKAIDLQYHDMRADRSLSARCGLRTLIDEADVRSAMTEPPTTTRAYFRGRCLAKWPQDIVAANWDSLVFDVGREPLRRVPMMEPLRGTAEVVASLIDESNTPYELLTKLGA